MQYKESILKCIYSFSAYLHTQRIDFANKYISDMIAIKDSEYVCDLLHVLYGFKNQD